MVSREEGTDFAPRRIGRSKGEIRCYKGKEICVRSIHYHIKTSMGRGGEKEVTKANSVCYSAVPSLRTGAITYFTLHLQQIAVLSKC